MTEQSRAMVRAARTVVIGLGLVALLYVLGRPLVHYAAVVACGMLFGVALSALAGGLSRHTPIPYRLAVGLIVLAIAGALGGLVAWTGPRIVDQASELD